MKKIWCKVTEIWAITKGLTQNFDVKLMNGQMEGRMDRRTDGMTKTIYPLTYFVCRGYNKKACVFLYNTLCLPLQNICESPRNRFQWYLIYGVNTNFPRKGQGRQLKMYMVASYHSCTHCLNLFNITEVLWQYSKGNSCYLEWTRKCLQRDRWKDRRQAYPCIPQNFWSNNNELDKMVFPANSDQPPHPVHLIGFAVCMKLFFDYLASQRRLIRLHGCGSESLLDA